ncbi:MAG: MBL fold metallo-hydrolase [Phenylobacterium sp.]|nr:MAG: MBL fold metallo-hydrolase [Phenylobacterium sp.]
MTHLVRAGGLAAALALLAAPVLASPYSTINAAAAATPITVHKLRHNIAMLEGSGGNITALTGPDGTLLVDTGIAVSKDKIQAALVGLDPGPLKLAILTHWHWDHADGDGWVRAAGADIIAEKNAVARLRQTIRVVEWEHTFAPIPAPDLPNRIITGETTLHRDGEIIRIRPYKPGHTDGDLSVYFTQADVLSVGDTFWNGMYPFIDYVGGGSIDGAIRAANVNIAMATAHTVIVPGHGPLGDRASQTAFRDMLVAIRGKVAALKAQGKTLAQVQAAKPTAAYDDKWGRSIIGGDLFTALVYRGV